MSEIYLNCRPFIAMYTHAHVFRGKVLDLLLMLPLAAHMPPQVLDPHVQPERATYRQPLMSMVPSRAEVGMAISCAVPEWYLLIQVDTLDDDVQIKIVTGISRVFRRSSTTRYAKACRAVLNEMGNLFSISRVSLLSHPSR